MTAKKTRQTASAGVVEHANRAVIVTVAPDGSILDRRTIVLTPPDLPTHPHHHEGSWAVGRYLGTPGAHVLPMSEVVALVERVREAAEKGAEQGLEALARDVPTPIGSIALRSSPPLPATTEERIADSRAQTFADSVMYRQAIAAAAEARGWMVEWYERDEVFEHAAAALGCEDIGPLLAAMGKVAGPPWQADHRLAAAAAITAIGRGVR